MADYMSREAAIEWFSAFAHMGEESIPTETVLDDLKGAIPTVDAVPVETLKQWLATIPFHDISNGNGACVVCFREDFEKAIKRLNSFREVREPVGPMKPKVARRAASEPVVRCGECIHFDPENYGGPTCDSVDGLQYPGCDDFCSNGERCTNQSADVRKKDGGTPNEP